MTGTESSAESDALVVSDQPQCLGPSGGHGRLVPTRNGPARPIPTCRG